MTTQGQDGYPGQRSATNGNSPFNVMHFIATQVLGGANFCKLVKVKKVTNEGGVAAVGFVDVQIMTNLIDGVGNATEHGTIFNVPYMRFQGGTNAVILDPQVDDIGIMVIADRDISAVKEAKKLANPGSLRRNNFADGLYLGGVLNGVPEQYVRFFEDGIEVKDKNGNTITLDDDGLELADEAGNTVTINSTGIDIDSAGVFTLGDAAGNAITSSAGGITINGVFFPKAAAGPVTFPAGISVTGNLIVSGTMQWQGGTMGNGIVLDAGDGITISGGGDVVINGVSMKGHSHFTVVLSTPSTPQSGLPV